MTDPDTDPRHDEPDADLVAFAHGELDGDAARSVRHRLARDPSLRAELAAVRAADEALLAALDAPRTRRLPLAAWRPALAAAALVVVGLMLSLPRDDRAAARNDVVGLSVQPVGGARQPVFTDVALEFTWENRLQRDGRQGVKVLPFRLGDDPAALAAAAAHQTHDAFVPLVVSATIHAPDGQRIPARLTADPLVVADRTVERVPLHRFELDTDTPAPYLGGRPGEREWLDDFTWSMATLPAGGPRRLLLDQVGEWTLELRVESVPPPEPAAWPTFAEPLIVVTKVFATGIVSEWGDEHDGLRARIVLATGCRDLRHAPLALQIQNVGDRARSYNVAGITQAPIPQPFHFRLATAAADAPVPRKLREDVPAVLGLGDMFVPQPPGSVRSIVVCAAYWDGPVLDDLDAGSTVRIDFHFEPTLWTGDDRELWRGELSSGVLRLPPRDRR